jgi:hypothetical protein
MVELGRGVNAPQAAKTPLFPARATGDELDPVYSLAPLSSHEWLNSCSFNAAIDSRGFCQDLTIERADLGINLLKPKLSLLKIALQFTLFRLQSGIIDRGDLLQFYECRSP